MEVDMEKPTQYQRQRAWEWVKSIGLALLLAFVIRTAVVEAFVIPSGSMEPTLQIGDRVLGSKFWFWFVAPHRREIVIFSPPSSAELAAGALIKRVIAVEGDVVEVRD